MADLQTVTIDPSKIKVRWEEPYTSESVNRATMAFPRGVYRGCIVAPKSTPDQTFRLAADPLVSGIYTDNAFVFHDQSNGFGIFVRDSVDPSFDMSARFSSGGAIPPGGEKWWVWADVDYATGIVTTGDYHVTLDGDPIPDDAIIFGTLEFSGGETTIQTANCSSASATLPFPTKREDGSYVAGDHIYGWLTGEEAWNVPSSAQKRGLNAAPTTPSTSNPFVTKADTLDKWFGEPHFSAHTSLAGVSKVKLSGYFYVGITSQDDATKYFSLRSYSDKRRQLYSSTGMRVYVESICRSDGITLLDPTTDADHEGFYQDPWVFFRDSAGSHSFVGDLYVYGFRKKAFSGLEQAPVQAFPNAGMSFLPHIEDTYVEGVSDSPDSLSSNDGQTTIEVLLGFINDRIKTIHPTVSSSNPVLLWRSNAKTTDGSVTKDTSSIYWQDSKFFIIMGGYLSSGTDITAGTGTGGVVMFQLTPSGINKYVKLNPTPGTSWAYVNPSNWDTYYLHGVSHHSFGGYLDLVSYIRLLGGADSKIQGSTSGSTDLYKFFESNDLPRLRIMYGMSTSGEMWITFNADWNNSTTQWDADVHDGSREASAIRLSSQGVDIYKIEDANVPTSWTNWYDYGIKKSLLYTSGDSTYICDQVRGENLYEVIRFGWGALVTPGTSQKFVDVCNFHTRWNPYPIIGEFTFGTPHINVLGSGTFSLVAATDIEDIDSFGFRVSVTETVTGGSICEYDNIVIIAT